MKTLPRIVTTLAGLALAAPLFAQSPNVDGEVTKIDTAQSKITLRHGEIKNLDMPAMTMAFRVSDPKMLQQVAVGDKVRFAAGKVNGSYTLTALVKTP